MLLCTMTKDQEKVKVHVSTANKWHESTGDRFWAVWPVAFAVAAQP
jgi:hypothetical protein